MARAKKVAEGVETVQDAPVAPVAEKKTRTRKKPEEKVVEVVEEKVEVKVEEKSEPVAAEVTTEAVEEKVVLEATETEVVEEVAEITPVAPVEVVEEVIEATTTEEIVEADVDPDSVVPEGFRPILRPTSVAGKPLGYVGCPKQVFDIVTRPGWRKGIETHKYRTQLFSILYWYQKNGSVSVRCNSSSKFAEVAQ